MEIQLQTGLPVSELVSLENEDINIGGRKGSLTVRLGKGRKQRQVPLNSITRKAIQDYLTVRPSTADGHLLQGRREPLTVDAVSKMLKKYGARVGLADRIHPHLFRHQFATELLRNKGTDIVAVAEMVCTRQTTDEKAQAPEDLFVTGSPRHSGS